MMKLPKLTPADEVYAIGRALLNQERRWGWVAERIKEAGWDDKEIRQVIEDRDSHVITFMDGCSLIRGDIKKGDKMKKEKKEYLMTIKPALEPTERHKIQDAMKKLGYDVSGGGQMLDGSECDISFNKA